MTSETMTDAATTTGGGLLTERIRDYVPFIAIALVILLFWAISGDRFMSLRNWTFIANGTSIYMTDGSVSGGTNISSVATPWLLSIGKFPAIFVVAAFMSVFYEKAHFGLPLKAVGGNEKVLRLLDIDLLTGACLTFLS